MDDLSSNALNSTRRQVSVIATNRSNFWERPPGGWKANAVEHIDENGEGIRVTSLNRCVWPSAIARCAASGRTGQRDIELPLGGRAFDLLVEEVAFCRCRFPKRRQAQGVFQVVGNCCFHNRCTRCGVMLRPDLFFSDRKKVVSGIESKSWDEIAPDAIILRKTASFYCRYWQRDFWEPGSSRLHGEQRRSASWQYTPALPSRQA